MFSGAEIQPHCQRNLGDFFAILKKKSKSSKKFFFEDWDFHSFNTHTSYMVTFFFNLMAICMIVVVGHRLEIIIDHRLESVLLLMRFSDYNWFLLSLLLRACFTVNP